MSADPFSLQQLAVTPGAHDYTQRDMAQRMRARVRDLPQGRPLAQSVGFMYERSGIERRHVEVRLRDLDLRDDWYRVVNEATLSMARRALDQLQQQGWDPQQCDGLVVVSATHSGFPSLGRRLQEELGLNPELLCHDLAGLGCAGPPQGWHLAHTLLESGQCESVCLVCVDAMGTYSETRKHHSPPSTSQLVAHCLASDGAAAAVLSSKPGPALLKYERATFKSRLWSDALDLNDLSADAQGQPLLTVGANIRGRLVNEVTPAIQALGEDPLLMHPGGVALMEAVRRQWPQRSDSVDVSLGVLREHGNVGAASALWVLADALERGLPVSPRLHLFALGPGIVTTLLTLHGAST